MKIIAFSGSLRKASYNTGLLQAAKNLMPANSTLEVISIHDIPLYNGDDEAAHGLPEAVVAVKDAIREADALLIATPEYNHSIPGVLKNALDWISRPSPEVFNNKPFGLISASPGGFGGYNAQIAWLPIIHQLNLHAFFEKRITVSQVHKHFDEKGVLTDDTVKENLSDFLVRFTEFCKRVQ